MGDGRCLDRGWVIVTLSGYGFTNRFMEAEFVERDCGRRSCRAGWNRVFLAVGGQGRLAFRIFRGYGRGGLVLLKELK